MPLCFSCSFIFLAKHQTSQEGKKTSVHHSIAEESQQTKITLSIPLDYATFTEKASGFLFQCFLFSYFVVYSFFLHCSSVILSFSVRLSLFSPLAMIIHISAHCQLQWLPPSSMLVYCLVSPTTAMYLAWHCWWVGWVRSILSSVSEYLTSVIWYVYIFTRKSASCLISK